MTFLRKFYYFLGSVYLAIFLIASVALFVVVGTFLESITESHRYAAYFTYSNPFFVALLWGFFVNILVSALRRWPFKLRHIPFLITHFGLLLILGGTLIKTYFGVQGTMSILEGSGSEEIFLSDTYVVQVEKRKDAEIAYYPLQKTLTGQFNSTLKSSSPHSDLAITLAEYAPQSVERMQTWIKGPLGYISGLQPFSVADWEDMSKVSNISVSTRANLLPGLSTPWNIYAGKTTDIVEVARKAYLQHLQIELTDPLTKQVLYKGPASSTISWKDGTASVSLEFSFSPVLGFEDPHILVSLTFLDKASEKICIPLQGKNSLKNINVLRQYFGVPNLTVDLHQIPSLVFLQDLHEDTFLFAFDSYGRVHFEPFRQDNLHSFIVYDQGFGGYAIQAEIPFAASLSRNQVEQAQIEVLKEQLKRVTENASQLAPPLRLLCEAECFVEFLQDWNNTNSWLYPVGKNIPHSMQVTLDALDWNTFSEREKKGCYWTHMLFKELEPRLQRGDNIMSILTDKKWPLLEQLEEFSLNNDLEILTSLTHQIFMVADQLPPIPEDETLNGRFLSAYLRAYEIHFSNFTMPDVDVEKMFFLECPLTVVQQPDYPQKKLEDNNPKITLSIDNGTKSEWISLSYDRFGKGIKWPIFDGEYTLRFQPQFFNIPYHLRLRTARQINYSNSAQPYSYECDLIITDKRDNSKTESTISMNNVYETTDGYRFYLSNISPPNETAAKRVQIVINYDPAKYWVTYPGAIILSIGIALLFWFRKK